MADVKSQIRDFYFSPAELKKLTGWPDVVIEYLLGTSDNTISAGEGIDFLLIAPLPSRLAGEIAEIEQEQDGIKQARLHADLAVIEERIARVEAVVNCSLVDAIDEQRCLLQGPAEHEDLTPRPIPYQEMRFGNGLNFTEFEYDGTPVFHGDATVWKDIKFPMAPPKTTGAGNPTLVTWNGNLRGYSFAVNDAHDFNGEEIDHDAKIGATATWHIHFISRDNETERTVKYQLEYAIEPASGAIAAPTTISAEFVIAANTAVNTPQRGNLGTFSVPDIAKLAYARLTRIASSGTEPTTDPVVGAIHFHYELDTIGSRQILTK